MNTIREAVRRAGLSGSSLCVHSSLRSFGQFAGGPAAVVDGILDEGCTLMVPAFSYHFMLRSVAGMRPHRNAWTYDSDYDRETPPGQHLVYSPDGNEIVREMGVVPAEVLRRPGRVRGIHPLCSFAALGPRAAELVHCQRLLDLHAPLQAMADGGGFVVLMGVEFTSLTLLHLAERRAGRRLFRRWANGPDGRAMEVEFSGCSRGFNKFQPIIEPLARRLTVCQSRWIILPAGEALSPATAAILADPMITHCGDPTCERCRDSIMGGPILE